MTEISETEIKSMTKEQNYMRGYEDGKSDVLDKIRDEIEQKKIYPVRSDAQNYRNCAFAEILEIINKYRGDNK